MQIDWSELAQRCRDRGSLTYGSNQAMVALEMIVGEHTLRDAVDYYVDMKPDFELVRQVLWRLRPVSAMDRCYEIYKSDPNLDRRRSAVELLRVVADNRALPWIKEFLDDPDIGIQNLGASMLDQLIWGGNLDSSDANAAEIEHLIQYAEVHANPQVRELTISIRNFMTDRDA